jgi:hypothetical protein
MTFTLSAKRRESSSTVMSESLSRGEKKTFLLKKKKKLEKKFRFLIWTMLKERGEREVSEKQNSTECSLQQ